MTSTDSIDPNIMELQPVFTQPSNHNLQPSQAVASGASNPQNGILKKFLKGEPKVLGALQILLALVILYCGMYLVIMISQHHYWLCSLYSFCGSLSFIISGCLSVAAAENHTKCLMQGCLITNIISMLFAGDAFYGVVVNLFGILHYDVPLSLWV
ncbi:membrane-spanning 4-domains subfamily A member 15-like isoform X3 [Tachyglossus aculeatus]|uniref:membrane-spanning 4-domains subfamily A member 15-like isoform X3 n=1 Tax=Tachyglossus aculeatus TaxID=9261 RepID=UPI0018F28EF7|nr:membrane-spanning 4-domains subfamily A member 15-like isoform X3 [Tachyglossus aculeatus]